MNKNVAIVVVILVLVVVAGYLIWLRSRTSVPVVPQPSPEEATVEPTATPEQTATPSASPKGREATGSMRQATSSSSTGR